ncbi:phage antirepressor KilAC domain-containing protein [Pseudomonas nitroreducens]|uniref:phage antirepressor KilAC domain-containing protein n=1 Tax=Pseudomonas nitroreducens TaxID=46680 RepID=UPI00106B78A7|nr:phage antirepressor KilAC domain-containing protein [Pseudomonas nitroreducens]MDG9855634.1 phage antirepressor KilAC domain-containing protein [Pseudomonas nitroreducens]
MNRNIREAATVLGLGEHALRAHLRADKSLNKDGTLAAQHIGKGHLFMDPRSRWNPKLQQYMHYSVVMVTEAGIDWLAKRLGISITVTQHKDHVA